MPFFKTPASYSCLLIEKLFLTELKNFKAAISLANNLPVSAKDKEKSSISPKANLSCLVSLF